MEVFAMRKLLLASAALSVYIVTANAQLQGPLSGTIGPGTFQVVGDILVEEGSSLRIEPNTTFLFTGNYSFEINGYLYAMGTVTDSIRFMQNNPGTTWSGLDFDNADNACTLEYCFVTGSNSHGIYLFHSGPTIFKCTIVNNSTPYGGGGIYVGYWGCGATISNCVISNNSAAGSGGGIEVCDTVTDILNCIISDNLARSGGGVATDQSNPTFSNCVISENSATEIGGGIFIYKGNPCISNCTISGNYAGWDGGGVLMSKSSPAITNCTIRGNLADEEGGAIWMDMGSPDIINTIVEGNRGNYGICFGNSSNATVSYSDFYDNENGNFTGIGPAGLGEIIGVNANGDSCDVYYNVFLDPELVYPGQNDYRLHWDSPCIDAGDPDPQYNDPDDTVADMGVFYYDQSTPVRILLTPHDAAIQIPAMGGSFEYTLWLTNIEATNPQFDFWLDITLPDGTIFGPVLQPVTAQLDSGLTFRRERMQNVPVNAPEGLYHFNAYAVVGMDTSFDDFNFIKQGGNGTEEFTDWLNNSQPSGTGSERILSMGATEFAVLNAHPNPFNPTTTVTYALPQASRVQLNIYNLQGRLVTELVNGWRDVGYHEVIFEAQNLASGMYIYRIQAGDFTDVKKMMLVK
ncbi:hypothetical protein CEE37_13300 [candidate division LCP-89 bacterium B3_LCP]|uniref:Secretion system C-terminal sorting domain-containing protein n=1 Tax=candidate division LCP-89 bacterium B3_LCP TaxID=2012998 RepID=A0A532USM3_UNCL8|nr:MAG: hypothetical protein CEE37_13300 [candidate division LCP-89 bacterium B3_LCP]